MLLIFLVHAEKKNRGNSKVEGPDPTALIHLPEFSSAFP